MSLYYLRYLTLAMMVFALSCGTDSRNTSTPERRMGERNRSSGKPGVG
jgi:hypothetical protein